MTDEWEYERTPTLGEPRRPAHVAVEYAQGVFRCQMTPWAGALAAGIIWAAGYAVGHIVARVHREE